ncbi:hypothetical protein [Eubacterium sp.]|uniref:hypothetical protein n=1 Tax=Eubacterium sp. TaxID=142586 RepID=UPI0025E09C1F|nr:hypothetical protein [Eubacterium sp.]MCR5630229.1 hypothetical protein [Eubacterium sp.]
MIKLFEEEIKDQGRKSSKGNQLKFERNGIWYKTDYLGYEGLVEYTISKLLAFSNLDESEYVDYELEQIEYNDNVFNGCKSNDFTEGWNLITLERLFKNSYGTGLNEMIYSIQEHTERLKILVEQVERVTGLKDFGMYMSKLLTIDALFLNEDRHTHNIAVMTNDKGEFKLAPIFDNGAGLMSDMMMEYPLSKDVLLIIDKVKAKTFCDDFSEQVDIAEGLYGQHIEFEFGYNEVKSIVDKANIYSEDTRLRVIELIMQMRRKYEYLFSKTK